MCISTSPSDPCVDAGFHPCYNDDVECTKLSDTEFSCGDCPRGMEGDGINCTGINEVCIGVHSKVHTPKTMWHVIAVSLSPMGVPCEILHSITSSIVSCDVHTC